MPHRGCPEDATAAPHPELITAKGNIALAPDKLRAIQNEALRLSPLVASGEIPKRDAEEALHERAALYGVGRNCQPGELERIISDGLGGRAILPPAPSSPAEIAANRHPQPSTEQSWRPLMRPSPPPAEPIPPWHPPPVRDALGRWRPGQSGNAAGRPPAWRRRQTLQPPPPCSPFARAVAPAPMTAAELIEIARCAYGKTGWQTALGAELGVDRTTINRWARARFRIADDRALEIGSLCVFRAQQNLAAVKKSYRRIVRQLLRAEGRIGRHKAAATAA